MQLIELLSGTKSRYIFMRLHLYTERLHGDYITVVSICLYSKKAQVTPCYFAVTF